MRASGVESAAKATVKAAPPPHPAVQMTEEVFRVARTSSDPAVLLRLGSAIDSGKGYRRLAMALHPDRVKELNPEQQARAEEAFKLAKAAWEGCPSNDAFTPAAGAAYEYQRQQLLEAKQKASAPPPPDLDPAAFDENLKAYQRAQAKAAEEAAKAAKAGAKKAREEALAQAKESLGELHGSLTRVAEQLLHELGVYDSAPVLKKLRGYNTQVANTTTELRGFDVRRPEAREQLETFRKESVTGLRAIYDELGPLQAKVDELKKVAQRQTGTLAWLRQACFQVRNQVQVLEQNQAPAADLRRWRDRLAVHSEQVERLASAIKASTKELAETERQLTKLRGAVPFKLQQATAGRKVENAQAQLDHTYSLDKKAFRGHAAEWATRIESISKHLAVATARLAGELAAMPLRARAESGGANLRFSLVIYARRPIEDIRSLRAQISDDVWAALPGDTRAELESLLSDAKRLEEAKVERPTRDHGTQNYAIKVEGLSARKVEVAWNQVVEEGLASEAFRREMNAARRDPNRFYPA